MRNYKIIKQIEDSKRLEVVCLDCYAYMWPLPSQMVDWEGCPMCKFFPNE